MKRTNQDLFSKTPSERTGDSTEKKKREKTKIRLSSETNKQFSSNSLLVSTERLLMQVGNRKRGMPEIATE